MVRIELFVGKVIFLGDFHQVFSVIPHGIREKKVYVNLENLICELR